MKTTKVKYKDGTYARDLYKTETGGLIHHNQQELDNYLKRKDIALGKTKKLESLEDEIESLKKMILDMSKVNNG